MNWSKDVYKAVSKVVEATLERGSARSKGAKTTDLRAVQKLVIPRHDSVGLDIRPALSPKEASAKLSNNNANGVTINTTLQTVHIILIEGLRRVRGGEDAWQDL